MKIEHTSENGILTVELHGKLDGTTSVEAQETLLPLIDNADKMIIDMKACSYLSSAGLRVLLLLAKKIAKKKGEILLACLSDEIKDIIEMTGFGNIFKNFDTIEECKNSFN